MTIDASIDIYKRVAATLRAHSWKSWCRFYSSRWGGVEIASLDAGDINIMIAERRRQKLSEATLHSQLYILKQLFKVAGVRWPDGVAKLGKANEVSEGFDSRDEEALRRIMKPGDFDILSLAIATGLRGMELFLVKKKDVFLDGGWIEVQAQPGAKTGFGRAMLGPTAKKLCKRMMAESRGSIYLVNPEGFGNYTKRCVIKAKWIELVFRPACRAAGVKKTFHQARHSTASKMVRAGRSLYQVQMQLRQSSPKMAQRYAHLNNSERQESVRCL